MLIVIANVMAVIDKKPKNEEEAVAKEEQVRGFFFDCPCGRHYRIALNAHIFDETVDIAQCRKKVLNDWMQSRDAIHRPQSDSSVAWTNKKEESSDDEAASLPPTPPLPATGKANKMGPRPPTFPPTASERRASEPYRKSERVKRQRVVGSGCWQTL